MSLPGLPAFLLDSQYPGPSPCFVIDVDKLRENAAILESVQNLTGARILLALKGYAAYATFPLLSRTQNGPLYGTCASSIDEARLGREQFGGEVHAFAAAWSEQEFRELLPLVNHITFNSLAQWRKFKPFILHANKHGSIPIKCGFRINPEYSEAPVPMYDPCAPGSRLGIRKDELARATPEDWDGISGIHFHTLCEQNADALVKTLAAVEKNFGSCLPKCKWLNFGGGHHITAPDYDLPLLLSTLKQWQSRHDCQIYLEPGEAVALNAGWLVATVLDIVKADMPIAILDVSAACHMPDVLEMPYVPPLAYISNGKVSNAPKTGGKFRYRLAGKSCLAGDIIGEYGFDEELRIGQRLAFGDMAIYSMVKTTTFNGLRLPSIAVFDSRATPPFTVVRAFGYEDFKSRLS